MARKSAPAKAPAKTTARPRRRRVSVTQRSWARERLETSRRELAMYDAIHEVLEFHRRKLRRKITHEEMELAAPAPVAPDFPRMVAPARAKR